MALVGRGDLGTVERVAAVGCWQRDAAYYARSPWAGHRRLRDVVVADGAMTNPFAHGLALALRLVDPTGTRPLRTASIEPYRAYPIETDDTASARFQLAGAPPVVVAVTLCAEHTFEPYVRVYGSAGRATAWYTRHRLRVETSHGELVETEGEHTELIDDLVAHLDTDPAADGLLSPLRATRAFTAALEAVVAGPPTVPIPERYQRVTDAGRTIPGIEGAVVEAADRGLLFSELGRLPWAVRGREEPT
jgi:predicted dehydrogenase